MSRRGSAIDPSERAVRMLDLVQPCRPGTGRARIYFATALYFSPHLDEAIVICSFDRRLRTAAAALALTASPGP